jgi:hypothetical protein
MSNFAQMKTWVAKRLLDPSGTSVSSEDVGEMINQAIDYWKKRRFWFNEKTETVVLTQSDNSIPLPDDYYIPSLDSGAFVIEYSGIRYTLQKLSEPSYNNYYLSNGIGQPFWWSKQASPDNYVVYPIPDKNYTLRCFYLKEYAVLSGDTDSNDWTTVAQDLIKYQALSYGMNDFRQDYAAADRFETLAQRQYQNMLLRTRKENATGRLTNYSTL